jgi:hypothetical protein
VRFSVHITTAGNKVRKRRFARLGAAELFVHNRFKAPGCVKIELWDKNKGKIEKGSKALILELITL